MPPLNCRPRGTLVSTFGSDRAIRPALIGRIIQPEVQKVFILAELLSSKFRLPVRGRWGGSSRKVCTSRTGSGGRVANGAAMRKATRKRVKTRRKGECRSRGPLPSFRVRGFAFRKWGLRYDRSVMAKIRRRVSKPWQFTASKEVLPQCSNIRERGH